MKKYMIIACTIFLYICLLAGQASTYDVIGNAEITRKILPSRNLVETTDSWRQYWDQNNKVPFTFMDKAHKAEQDVQVKSQIIQAKKQAIMIGQKKYIFTIKDIKIVQVIPRRGNNPINQEDPIKNVTLPSGQVVVGQAADEVGESSSSSPSCATCSPSEYLVQPCPYTDNGYGSGDFFLNPCTSQCAVGHVVYSPHPDMDHPFYVQPLGNPPSTFMIGPGTNGYVPDNPWFSGEDRFKYSFSPTTGYINKPTTVTIRDRFTGKSWRITILLTNFNNGAKTYILKVLSVVPQ